MRPSTSVLIAALALPTLSVRAAPPTFELLPSVGVESSSRVLARGISGNGQVIAGSQTPQMWERPFIWRKVDGQWELIALPGESTLGHGRPVTLSYDGDTIAGMSNIYVTSAIASGTPALWTHVLSGEPTLVSPLDDGSPATHRRGIFSGLSADGSLTAGFASLRNPTPSPGELWSFTGGVTSKLSPTTTNSYFTAILCGNPMSADGSIFVGSVSDTNRCLAQKWTAATGFVELPTPATGTFRHSRAESISRDGRVIGGYLTNNAVTYNEQATPCLWTDEGRIDLPVPVSFHSRVTCLSGDGSIAGGVQYQHLLRLDYGGFNLATAILWIDGQRHVLSTYLTSQGVDLEGVNLNWITGISDDGRVIVGFGTRSTSDFDNVSFIITLPSDDCPADLTSDGVVDFSDYLEFLNLFDALDPRVDFNKDGIVDFADYLEFLNLFDVGC